jgi:hypothetical protein
VYIGAIHQIYKKIEVADEPHQAVFRDPCTPYVKFIKKLKLPILRPYAPIYAYTQVQQVPIKLQKNLKMPAA